MATLFLAAATTAGGPAAGLPFAAKFALGIAATAIDSLVISPLFQKRNEGQRLQDLELTQTKEGSAANRLYGGTVRAGGTLVWQTRLREKEDAQRGSKGGSGGSFIKYRYYCDVGIEISRLKRGKQLKAIKHVFADGKPFWGPLASKTFSSTKITASNTYIDLNDPTRAVSSQREPVTEILQLISDEAAGGPDLTQFQSGRRITISGFTSAHPLASLLLVGANAAVNSVEISVKCSGVGRLSRNDTLVIQNDTGTYRVTTNHDFNGSVAFPDTQLVSIERIDVTTTVGLVTSIVTNELITPTSGATANNGTFVVESRGQLSSTQSFITIKDATRNEFFDSIIRFAGKSPAPESITLSQSDTSFSKTQAGDVRFYLGSRTQLPDPTIIDAESEALGSSAHVLAHRGRALMFIEDLEVTDFGNRVPNFEFVCEVEEDASLSSSLGEMFLDAGYSPGEYAFNSIPSTTQLGGYIVRGAQQLRQALQPIMLANHLTSRQTAGQVQLFPRTIAPLVDVSGKTVAFAPGGESPRPGRVGDNGDVLTQQVAVVNYIDPANEWQTGSKTADGAVIVSEQLGEFDTDITMTGDEAQKLANVLFELGRIGGRRSIKFDLAPSFIGQVSEGTRVRFNTTEFGQDWYFTITRLEEGANGIISCEGIEEDLEAFEQTSVTGEGTRG